VGGSAPSIVFWMLVSMAAKLAGGRAVFGGVRQVEDLFSGG